MVLKIGGGGRKGSMNQTFDTENSVRKYPLKLWYHPNLLENMDKMGQCTATFGLVT